MSGKEITAVHLKICVSWVGKHFGQFVGHKFPVGSGEAVVNMIFCTEVINNLSSWDMLAGRACYKSSDQKTLMADKMLKSAAETLVFLFCICICQKTLMADKILNSVRELLSNWKHLPCQRLGFQKRLLLAHSPPPLTLILAGWQIWRLKSKKMSLATVDKRTGRLPYIGVKSIVWRIFSLTNWGLFFSFQKWRFGLE